MTIEMILPIVIQLIGGVLGGNAVGTLLQDINLGTLGNSVVGAIGGGILGQIISALLPTLARTMTIAGDVDLAAAAAQVVGGGVGGAVLVAIVGAVRQGMSGNRI